MRLHPLHPMSVHAPLTCLLVTPFADLAAHVTGQPSLWALGALTGAGAVGLGLLAMTLGALDFERAHAKAPRTVIAHASAMIVAVTLSGVSLFGRIGAEFDIIAPPPAWAIAAGLGAFAAMIFGAYFGGDLVYRHGVNVARDP